MAALSQRRRSTPAMRPVLLSLGGINAAFQIRVDRGTECREHAHGPRFPAALGWGSGAEYGAEIILEVARL
jgi:hypothetical protein